MKNLFLATIAAVFFCACADDNSVSAPDNYNDNKSSAKRESVSSIYELGSCTSKNRGESIYVTSQGTYYTCAGGDWISDNEQNNNQTGNSQYSSSQNVKPSSSQSSSRYSSSSQSESKPIDTTPAQSIYTTSPVEIAITLTDYEQLKSMDMENNHDGDPRIHFIVKTYNDDIRRDSLKTDVINLGDNIGSWSGAKKMTLNLSKNIDRITICPIFVDADVLFNDTEYNTRNCFDIDKVGQKIGKTIKIEDAGTYYTLDFTVVFK
ncbi:MAG: hypothetical protein MJZ22_02795 [Candidatus Saccharibacteria bacterium]|nr:hypothetical protein [Candidatus Saccharibacteria bacterium]